ncbi:hypothetical protein [Ekhidna sp.]
MKKIKNLFFLTLLVFTISCNEQLEQIESIELQEKSEQSFNEEFVEISIPEALQSTKELSEEATYLIQEINIVTAEGQSVNGKISLVVNVDDNLSYLGLSSNLLSELKLSKDFWIENTSEDDIVFLKDGLADCLNNCRDKYEKGKGRGKCNLGCWGEAILGAVTEIVIAIVD